MSRVEDMLARYIAEHVADPARADPRPYLGGLDAPERARLEALIDEYLARAPRREWDESAYPDSKSAGLLTASLAQSLGGESGLWPSLLPRLRNAAQIKRSDLVAELASRLGAQSKRKKVARYYNRMEQGLLRADGVSDTVLAALAGILGQSADALRRAGEAVRPGGDGDKQHAAAELAFARLAQSDDSEASARADAIPPDDDWDEVDRLFTGG